jgi:hypothetical protein
MEMFSARVLETTQMLKENFDEAASVKAKKVRQPLNVCP